jgi:hypothetical protein
MRTEWVNDDSSPTQIDRAVAAEKLLRLVIPNGNPEARPPATLELAERVVELTFDDGILVTCHGCGRSWRVEDHHRTADWWLCPATVC